MTSVVGVHVIRQSIPATDRVDQFEHTIYLPFAADTVLTDDLDHRSAPVLTTITTPARNGVYRPGHTDADPITPTGPDYYIPETTFAGDDRVQTSYERGRSFTHAG